MSDLTKAELRDVLHVAAIRAWLVALESAQEAPGTLPLHDALYALKEALDDGEEQAFDRAAQVLVDTCARWPDHPVAGPIGVSVEGREVEPIPRTLEEVLSTRVGVPAHDDPLEALQRYFSKLDGVQAALRHNVATAKGRVYLLERSTSALVTVLLIVISVAVIGWGAALGWWTVGIEDGAAVGGSLPVEP